MTPDMQGQQGLIDLYAKHPLQAATILARIVRQRGTLDGITELDLAHDSRTEITDQNHVGGVASVVQLAARAGVGPESRVLDIGAGLGGSARCLAYFFGCRVDGVELSPLRCADATTLSQRVGLAHLVTITCGDILSVEAPRRRFDVIWGQGAWMHIADTAALLDRAAGAIVPGGRLVFEEGYRKRSPRDDAEAGLLAELERLWGGHFLSSEAWSAALTRAAFDQPVIDELTDAFVADFERLATIARTHGEAAYPPHEVAAFEHALTLARSGVIGYARFATRH